MQRHSVRIPNQYGASRGFEQYIASGGLELMHYYTSSGGECMITVDVDGAVSMMLTMKWQASVAVHCQATGGLYGVRRLYCVQLRHKQ